MALLLERPWTQQPPGRARIDWASPLSAGLVYSLNLADVPTAAAGTLGEISTSGTIGKALSVGKFGPLSGISGSSSVWSAANPNDGLLQNGPVTHAFLAKITSVDSNFGTLFRVSNSSDVSCISAQRNGTSNDLIVYRGSGNGPTFSGVVASIADGNQHLVVIASAGTDPGTAASLWIDGVKHTALHPGGNGSTPSSGVSLKLFSYKVGDPAFGSDGEWYQHHVWNRMLGDAEVAALTENPQRLYSQRRIWVPQTSATGSYTLNAETGAYTFTGSNAVLLYNHFLTLDSASYSLTGSNATLLKGLILDAQDGSYTLTGSDAALVYNKLLNASSGSYSVTGVDANLIYTPTSGAYVLNAGSGAYVLTGSDVTFAYSGGLVTLKAGSWIRYRIIT